jgi:Fe/S biogenesis protein NfuA
MINKIEKILNEEIRPALSSHNGNIELIDIDNNIVFIRLLGGCQGCSMSKMTLTQGIEKTIQRYFPELTIQDITDHQSGLKPFYSHKNGKIPF